MKPGNREQRRNLRAKMAQAVRICPCDIHYPEEVCKTANVSRGGFYFVSSLKHYYVGMMLHVTRNYRPGDALNREELADIVRVDKLAEGEVGIGVRILMPR